MPGSASAIVEFLLRIGIPVREGRVAADSFLPGLRIVDGVPACPQMVRWLRE